MGQLLYVFVCIYFPFSVLVTVLVIEVCWEEQYTNIVAPLLPQPATTGAFISGYGVMQGVRDIIQDWCQFGYSFPVSLHWNKGPLLDPAAVPGEPIQSSPTGTSYRNGVSWRKPNFVFQPLCAMHGCHWKLTRSSPWCYHHPVWHLV